MGGCASKKAVMGTERLNQDQASVTSSLTCKHRSGVSGVTTSTGSQLRAKTAWQTSARNLRMSLSRSRKRQESYRLRVNNDDSDSVEEEELDSAGGGGRAGVRGGRKSPGRIVPSPTGTASGGAAPSGYPVSSSVAWESPARPDGAALGGCKPKSPRDIRSSTPRAAVVTATTSVPITTGIAGYGRNEDPAHSRNSLNPDRVFAADSCVQSFRVNRQATQDSNDDADTADSRPDTNSPAVAPANAAEIGTAVAVQAARRQGAAAVTDGGAVNPSGPSSSDSTASIPVAHSPDGSRAAMAIGTGPGREGGVRAPRTSSPAAHEITTARRGQASVNGGDGGWTAPIPASPNTTAATTNTATMMATAPAGGPPGTGAAAGAAAAAARAAAASPSPPATPGAAAAAAAKGGDAAGADGSAQWVIRPGPPVESVYALGEVLGKGSFGVVRLATHLATGARVAVKTIRKSLLRASDVSSLRREVEILHHLSSHPHISQLLGVFEEPGQLHLVLELYQGGDLFDAIIAVGRHSERAAADVMRTVLTAISYCHAMGVAHRDIKPENFMLTTPPHPPAKTPGGGAGGIMGAGASQQQHDLVQQLDLEQKRQQGRVESDVTTEVLDGPGGSGQQGEEESVGARLKLIDFGLSVFCSDAVPLTETVGTSYYVAPEVLSRRYNRSADVWSAGVILHILLTGYAPFDGRNDQEILRAVQTTKLDLISDPIWGSISREAMAVLTAMLDRDPARRATADQLLAMPWLGRTAATCTASTAPLPGVVSERMRRFARMNSFKKEARRVVAGLMRPEEVAGLVAQFKGLDADGDGKLSVRELKEGLARQELHSAGSLEVRGRLGEEELRHLMERTDLDGDGLLDQSEFLGAALPTAVITRQAQQALAAAKTAATAAARAIARPGSRTTAASAAAAANPLAAAFAHFDADGSGFITPDELRSALAGHHPTGEGPDVRALLRQLDRDEDGRISYPEFLEMMVQEVDDDEFEPHDEGRRIGGSGGGACGGGGNGGGDNGGANAAVVQGRNTVRRDRDMGAAGAGRQRMHANGAEAKTSSPGGSRRTGQTQGPRGPGAGAALGMDRKPTAAWAVTSPTGPTGPAAAAAAAVVTRAHHGNGAAAAQQLTLAPRGVGGGGLNSAPSTRAKSGVRSYSGGVTSFAWCDECNSRPGDEAASAAAGTYVPPRLSPLGAATGAAAAACATTGQRGIVQAAQAAALTLMSPGEDPESLLHQMAPNGPVAPGSGAGMPRVRGPAAAAAGSSRPQAQQQQQLVPQPPANRRARRHSATEAINDTTYGSIGVSGGGPGAHGIGGAAERSVRAPRASEGPACSQQQKQHAGLPQPSTDERVRNRLVQQLMLGPYGSAGQTSSSDTSPTARSAAAAAGGGATVSGPKYGTLGPVGPFGAVAAAAAQPPLASRLVPQPPAEPCSPRSGGGAAAGSGGRRSVHHERHNQSLYDPADVGAAGGELLLLTPQRGNGRAANGTQLGYVAPVMGRVRHGIVAGEDALVLPPGSCCEDNSAPLPVPASCNAASGNSTYQRPPQELTQQPAGTGPAAQSHKQRQQPHHHHGQQPVQQHGGGFVSEPLPALRIGGQPARGQLQVSQGPVVGSRSESGGVADSGMVLKSVMPSWEEEPGELGA